MLRSTIGDAFSALLSARYIDSLELLEPDGAPAQSYNEEPPLMYQNNVLNSNTDVSTYDLVGPYYRVSLNYKF